MGIITKPYDFSPATTIQDSQVDSNFDTLYSEFNGNIENANVKSTAAISESKISFSTSGHTHNGTDSALIDALVSTTKYAPQGMLINGRISASVASSNLTVSIKGMDGNDPSATNKVYIRIGNSVRTLTSSLSVTKNAGTNWMDLGGTELATQEVDLFVYLGYNATDGVVIGFSRIPYATKYSDFSSTSTNATYAAISTITNAASTDEYELVGRFNATLSAGAGYTWSIPGTAVVVNRPIYETRWLTFTPSYTGFSSNPSATFVYQISGKNCNVSQLTPGSDGTSNSVSFDFTVPIPCERANQAGGIPVLVKDSGSLQDTMGYMRFSTAQSKTVTVLKTNSSGNFTNSGAKNCYFSYFGFETD